MLDLYMQLWVYSAIPTALACGFFTPLQKQNPAKSHTQKMLLKSCFYQQAGVSLRLSC